MTLLATSGICVTKAIERAKADIQAETQDVVNIPYIFI